jgi:hypothetical protein
MGIFRPKSPASRDGEAENMEEFGFHEEEGGEEEEGLDSDVEEADTEEDVEKEEEDEEEGMDYDDDESEEVGSDDSETIAVSKSKIIMAKKFLENIRDNNEKLIALFGGLISPDDETRIGIAEAMEGIGAKEEEPDNVIEGVFDGENMIGPDGKEYSVPANYASKSKLVEGDMLKLTITDRGAFVYKQTKPVERRRIIGQLEKDEEGNYVVLGDQRKWKVLTASITYFKGNSGDKAVILIPIAGDSQWGAVENVIRNK